MKNGQLSTSLHATRRKAKPKTDMTAGTVPRDPLSKIASDSFVDVGSKFPDKFTVIIDQGLSLQI